MDIFLDFANALHEFAAAGVLQKRLFTYLNDIKSSGLRGRGF